MVLPDAKHFLYIGLYDYPQIIKKPMDLGTVKKNITARSYPTIHAAADDVRLVWTNCMTYNADGSDFFMLAKTLQKKWDEKLAKYMVDFNVASGPGMVATSEKVTLEDKKAFAKSLFKLTKEDLGKIIVEIDSKSPGALTKNAAEDECEINVDKIPATLLGELRAFVASCTASSSQPPKKKKKQ
jgi:Bromodomain/Bromodomain extra-terminal - transcription regulation